MDLINSLSLQNLSWSMFRIWYWQLGNLALNYYMFLYTLDNEKNQNQGSDSRFNNFSTTHRAGPALLPYHKVSGADRENF